MKKFFNLKNKYKRTISFLSIFVFSFTIFSIPFLEIQGALNKEINYQGKLTLSSGVAVSNATYNMEFKLYTTSTGGSAIWTETRTGGDRVNVSNGLFSVMLGEVTTLAGVDFNQTLYLGVTVGGSTVTPSWDSEMTPRKKIGVVPGAIMAETVTGASQSAITSLGDLTGLTVTGISNLRGILADNGTVTNDRIGISIASVGANRFDGTITNLDLTANRTWSLPNNSGTIALTTDIPAQVYPGAGIPNSTGSAWGTSYTTTGSGTVLALATSPTFVTPSLGVATATSIDLTAGNLDVNDTTYASQTGVITKNGTRFLHDFNYGNNGTVTTVGANVFLGINSGNFTMGSTATSQYQASYNTGVGNGTLNALTTGSRNTAIGYRAGDLINSGTQNTAVGYLAMSYSTSGSSNSAFGTWAFIGNTEGNYNTAIGYQAGRFIAGGSTANTTSDYGVYLGVNAKAGADNNQNEIVIGYDATGNGSNTATIGNISLLRTYLTGVNLKAGTATAGTAPLKLTAGTNLTTTEAGAIEYDGTHLYFTATNGGTRYQLDQQSGGGMVYPGAGIPNSTGSAWGTSYTTTGSGTVLALATSPAFTTNINTPLIIGGTTTTSPLTLRSTSGVGTTGADIIFQTGNNGATEAMRILNNGNVGIGTNNPQKKLDINGSIRTSSHLLIGEESSSGAPSLYLQRGGASLGSPSISSGVYFVAGDDWYHGDGGGGVSLAFNYGDLNFSTTPSGTPGSYATLTNRLTIKQSGNVGIGVTAPTAALHLKAGTATAGTAPLKLTSGTNLTTTEAGAIEYDGTHLYFTATNGGTRYQLDQQAGGVAWDAIGDPSGNGAIAMGSTVQTMDWGTATTQNALSMTGGALTTGNLLSLTSNTLTSGTLLDITSAGTGALTGQKGINVSLSDYAGIGQITYGAYISNTHSGGGTNYGAYFEGSGSTSGSNYGIYSTAGNSYNPIAGVFKIVGSDFMNFASGTGIKVDVTSANQTSGNITGINIDNLTSPYVLVTETALRTGTNWDYAAIFESGNVGIGDTTPDGLLDLDSSATTGINLGITNTGVYTGTGLLSVVANSATTGVVGLMTANGLSSGSILSLTSAGTAGLTNQRGLNIALSGTNATAAQTTYGAYISNTHDGTTSTNVGLYASATGGTTANYAAQFNGDVNFTAGGSGRTINVGGWGDSTTGRLTIRAANSSGMMGGTGSLYLYGGDNYGGYAGGGVYINGGAGEPVGNIYLGNIAGSVYIGGTDVALSRSAANVLALASGDSFNLVSGSLQVAGTEVVTSGRIIRAADGAVGAPAFTFFGDTDNGMWRPTTNEIAFSTAGTERLRIDAAGDVGIGQTTPTAFLHIKAGTATAGTAPLKLTTGTALTTPEDGAMEYHNSHLYFTIGSTRYQLDQQSGGGMVYPGAGIPNSTGSAWGTSYTTTGSGTVLALATSPAFTTNINTPLIIGGTTTTSPLTLRSTSGVGTTGADIIFQTGNNGATEAMRILNNGRVGIGTASPNSLFQVAGLISFDTTEYNTEIGQETGLNLVAGAQYNTFLGHQAGRGGNTGGTNVADYNVAIGYRAFYANTTGGSNTAIGTYALNANTTGDSNSAIGYRALSSNTGGYNNTANGMYALYSNLTGNYNNANGQYSLFSNTTGGYNTAFGNYSLNANVAGSNATAFGYNAMRYANSSATPFFNYNLAIGYEALMGTTTSANNTGNYNTAIGYQSSFGYETAARNTTIGYFAGRNNVSGNNNLLIGYQAGDALSSGSTNIALGYDVDLPSATADNQMTIGNLIFASGGFGTGTTVGSGFIGIGKNNPAQRLDVSGNTAISGQTMLGLTSVSTNAQLSLSNTINTNGSSTAIAGIHGDYTFNNGGSSGYVQVGNRFVFNNAPTTNSNTMVGEIIRTIDNTSLANLVRGLDITSNAGSNTAGTNTGLRATGGTFGVQGITTGLAGGVSVPAALYGENTGATNGNILRLFSNSMTSAPSFATFYHDTSTFTGTGLLMDFATGSGTFSGNFVDFQRNNTTLFRVTNAGIVSLGLSSTASTTAVCSSLANGVSPTSGVSYELRDCSGSPVADYAEMYPVENGIEKGDIVATGNELINTYDTTNGEIDWNKIKGKVTKLIKSDHPYQKNIIGIVSDNYNDFSSTGYNIKEENNPIPVALSGRVPVKISLTSESIKAGDYVTTSNESGKATKATKAGFVIGKALEDWDNSSGKNTLMVFVEQGFYNGQSIESFIGLEIDSDENILENIFAKQVLNKLIENKENGGIVSSEILTDRLVSGLEIITPEVTTNKLYVKNEIIIDGLSFFNGQSLFFDSVIFEKEVSFEVPPLFNKDTAGFALIKQDTKFVRINFENPYISTPVVTASISFDGEEGESEIDPDEFFSENIQYLINEKGPTGFTIVLNQEAPFDIRFSWIALSVKDPNIYESVIDGLIIEGSKQDNNSDESQGGVLSDEIKEEEIDNVLINEEEIDLNLDQPQDVDIEEVIIEGDVSLEEEIEEDMPDISTEEDSEQEVLPDNEII